MGRGLARPCIDIFLATLFVFLCHLSCLFWCVRNDTCFKSHL